MLHRLELVVGLVEPLPASAAMLLKAACAEVAGGWLAVVVVGAMSAATAVILIIDDGRRCFVFLHKRLEVVVEPLTFDFVFAYFIFYTHHFINEQFSQNDDWVLLVGRNQS